VNEVKVLLLAVDVVNDAVILIKFGFELDSKHCVFALFPRYYFGEFVLNVVGTEFVGGCEVYLVFGDPLREEGWGMLYQS
jgi:hypothetical protein